MFYFSPQCLISNNRYSVKNVKIATTMSIHPFVCFKDQRKPDIAFCDKIIPNCFACGRCSFLFLICLFFPSLRKSLHCDRYFFNSCRMGCQQNLHRGDCFNNFWGYYTCCLSLTDMEFVFVCSFFCFCFF